MVRRLLERPPSVSLPARREDDLWGPVELSGWRWDRWLEDDENLLNLAYVASLNTWRFQRGLGGGKFGAALVRPPRRQDGRRHFEVLGVGMHYPPSLGPSVRRVPLDAADDGPIADDADGSAETKRIKPKQARGVRSPTLHAEVMVVAACARDGIATDGCWLYCMRPPCWVCCKAILMAGVSRIIFQAPEESGAARQMEVAKASGAEWTCLPCTPARIRIQSRFREIWNRHHLHAVEPRAHLELRREDRPASRALGAPHPPLAACG